MATTTITKQLNGKTNKKRTDLKSVRFLYALFNWLNSECVSINLVWL